MNAATKNLSTLINLYKIGIDLHPIKPKNQMGSNKEVTHTGIVKTTDSTGITISMIVNSGCASCQIKGSCNMSEQTEKELNIECDSNSYKVGQMVKVHLQSSQGFLALFLGYIIPLIVLIAVVVITMSITQEEGIAGLVGLASLAPYYLILYLSRNKIKNKFTYVVHPLNQ